MNTNAKGALKNLLPTVLTVEAVEGLSSPNAVIKQATILKEKLNHGFMVGGYYKENGAFVYAAVFVENLRFNQFLKLLDTVWTLKLEKGIHHVEVCVKKENLK